MIVTLDKPRPAADKVAITLRDALIIGGNSLKDAGIELPHLDARVLLLAASGHDAHTLVRAPETILSPKEFYLYLQMVARRVRREPVAYITQKKSFWSLDFDVSCDTLIPRPDSETLIETALAWMKSRSRPYRIVDVGTGSGCLLLSLLSEFPLASGIGVDVSEKALEVAARNARHLGLDQRSQWKKSFWLDGIEPDVDVLISNPPYIPTAEIDTLQDDVAKYEPRLALDGGEDGMNPYRILAETAASILTPEGLVIVEIGAEQCADVSRIFSQRGWLQRHVAKDLGGIERCIVFTVQQNETTRNHIKGERA
jgi:release factor glutamine methyltransferase